MKRKQDILSELSILYKTDLTQGLSAQEAQQRLEQLGPNSFAEAKPESWAIVFLRQFQSPLIYMLLVAAVIIFFIGTDKLDAFIISGVLAFNALIGTIQEGRTRSILDSLRKLITSTTIVVRDGKKKLIHDADLVVGDIILLQEGERVPADAFVLEGHQLQLDEALLTGESEPVYKSADTLALDTAHREAAYIVLKGTYVLSGTGKALVFATGLQTRIGKIHQDVQEINTEMPLKREIDRLSYCMLFGVLSLCLVLFVIGIAAGQPPRELLTMLTALFICVVPEGLPVVMTLVLVTGVYQMAKQRVLVKQLQAVEGLGRADVIAIDKTGTLTRNELMVSKVIIDDRICCVTGQGYYVEGSIVCDNEPLDELGAALSQLLTACALLNGAEITYDTLHHTFDIKGDPTEAALAVFARKMAFEQQVLVQDYRKIYELPFNPATQMHVGFFAHENTGVMFMIGAPERVMQFGSQHKETQASIEQLLSEGLRVLAIAGREFDLNMFPAYASDDVLHAIAQSLITSKSCQLYGFVGIQDAIRSEVGDMVKQAKQAGLEIIMATGDHKATALYVARQTGIFTSGNRVLTGQEMSSMSDEQLLAQLKDTTVYARVTPREKMRLIELFHKNKQIIAMTGDGINDAPALVAADLGIAMGGIGTEVAKKAADIILLDDSFASIIHAIEQGRHIFYTLKRVVLYFFSTNMAEVLIVLFALLINAFGIQFPLPLTAAQILWLNLVTDGFLDVSISMEPHEAGLLRKKWLQQRTRLVDRELVLKVFFYALPMACGSLGVFIYYYKQDIALARTMTLLCMAMYQWFNAWNCRSENKSLLQIGLFSNKWLLVATSFVLFLQLMLVYAPFMHYIFKTVPLDLYQWLSILAITFPIVLLDELRKLIVRAIWPEAPSIPLI